MVNTVVSFFQRCRDSVSWTFVPYETQALALFLSAVDPFAVVKVRYFELLCR